MFKYTIVFPFLFLFLFLFYENKAEKEDKITIFVELRYISSDIISILCIVKDV